MSQNFQIVINKKIAKNNEFIELIGKPNFLLTIDIQGEIGTNLSKLEVKLNKLNNKEFYLAKILFYFSNSKNEILTDEIDLASNSILLQQTDIGKYLIVRIIPLLDKSEEIKLIYGKIKQSINFQQRMNDYVKNQYIEKEICFKNNKDNLKQKKILQFFKLQNLFIDQIKIDFQDKKIEIIQKRKRKGFFVLKNLTDDITYEINIFSETEKQLLIYFINKLIKNEPLKNQGIKFLSCYLISTCLKYIK